MLILVLINLIIIVFIYLKYHRIPKNIEYKREYVENEDSLTIGYINDKGIKNNFDLILAEIIELNIKGYITIEYNKQDGDKYFYTVKQNIDLAESEISRYEMLIINFLFSNSSEITKNELEDKFLNTFNSYNMQYIELENELNERIIKENIIDIENQKALQKYRNKYIKVSIIITIVALILSISNVNGFSLIYILMYIVEKIVSISLLLKADSYTDKGKVMKYNIDKYKIGIEDKEFLENKNSMKDIVKQKEFAISIALHINSVAKEAFISDQMKIQNNKKVKKVSYTIFLISTLILIVLLLFAKIIASIPRDAIIWVFIILAIIIAASVDIVFSKSYKRKK